MPPARNFGTVDQAVKSITTVDEYIKVGMEIANEVAMDFVENDIEHIDEHTVQFRKLMIEFVRMERDLKQFQEAVEFVKEQAKHITEPRVNLEAMLDQKLAELKQGNKEHDLIQHEKVLELNQRLAEAKNPEGALKTLQMAPIEDEDIELTQQTISTRCPYTGSEMVVPMKNKLCGHNYEREGIVNYIKQRRKKAKCPVSGCANEKPMELSDLEENKELKRYIERKNRQAGKRK
ncbi:hypothetical protein CHS0354_016103 [Potamilus streckersoni]|uniref:E3 SUMO-protein ligase NSE2 n=1 Tax=Potamilus streckersoni TaxID=2493646 RepID=A0AAE0W500_9BIVA|nr:hypothetical protein CHS0354_016103 [Potamilus streckersoni]